MKQQTQLIAGAFVTGILFGLLLALWWRIGQIHQNEEFETYSSAWEQAE